MINNSIVIQKMSLLDLQIVTKIEKETFLDLSPNINFGVEIEQLNSYFIVAKLNGLVVRLCRSLELI